jgi:hypothetical protein
MGLKLCSGGTIYLLNRRDAEDAEVRGRERWLVLLEKYGSRDDNPDFVGDVWFPD